VDQELILVVHQITKTELQIKYHEQTLSGSIVPDRSDTIQTCFFNLEKGMLWSTVSNAADRSRRTRNTGLP